MEKKVLEIKKDTALNYNKFINNILDANIKEEKLVNESDIKGFVNNSDIGNKMKTLATKTKLKIEQDKIIKLQTYDLITFICQSIFV